MGIIGLQDQFKIFKSSANIGSILVFFNEIGASYFFKNPVNELFNQSLSLDYLIAKAEIDKVEELLSAGTATPTYCRKLLSSAAARETGRSFSKPSGEIINQLALNAMVKHQTPDFTLEQIKAAHAKVKSGADFPSYIKEIKALGVIAYEHFIADGRINYFGNNGYVISSDPKWENKEIAKTGSTKQLTLALKTHQAGKTSYFTFCHESSEAGVEKWVVALNTMTCTYYDLKGTELVVETIPQ